MSYKITQIIKSEPVEGKYGPQIRTSFKVEEEQDRTLSCFSKYPLTVGQEIDGSITTTEKEGRTYHNFKFTPKTFETKSSPTFQPQPDQLRVERKLDALMTEIQMMRTVLGDILSKVDKDINGDNPF